MSSGMQKSTSSRQNSRHSIDFEAFGYPGNATRSKMTLWIHSDVHFGPKFVKNMVLGNGSAMEFWGFLGALALKTLIT